MFDRRQGIDDVEARFAKGERSAIHAQERQAILTIRVRRVRRRIAEHVRVALLLELRRPRSFVEIGGHHVAGVIGEPVEQGLVSGADTQDARAIVEAAEPLKTEDRLHKLVRFPVHRRFVGGHGSK